MLQNIRNNTQSLLAKIFIGLIIVIFGMFGIGSMVTTYINQGSILSINGVDINDALIESRAQTKTREFLAQLGEDAALEEDFDTSMFREVAIEEIIQEQLLLQTAEESGMAISPAYLDRLIARTTEFQIDGVFDPERARLMLQSIGYTPSLYRQALRDENLINQLVSAYQASGFVTPYEVEAVARLTLEKRDLRYLTVPMTGRVADMEVSDEEILAFYEANQQQYMQGEMVAIEYLELNKADLVDEISISDERIRAQYDMQTEDFQSQIERRASHILLQANNEEEYQVQQGVAQELKSRIDSGESFEDLVTEYSDDIGSADFGGDVGYTTGDTFVEEFENALRSLEIGEISAPVRTEFGYHLIKLTEQSASEFESYEQSRDRIRDELVSAEVTELYNEKAEQLAAVSFESLDLEEPARQLGLEIQTTDLFERRGGAGIASNSAVTAAAFSTEIKDEGFNSDLISLDDGRSVVIRVIDQQEPQVLPLEEVRAEIEINLQTSKAREAVNSIGDTIISSLENGSNINSLLELQDLSWVNVDELQRSETGMNPELLENIFSVPAPQSEADSVVRGFQLSSGDYTVVELTNVTTGSPDELEEAQRDSIAGFINERYAVASFTALLDGAEQRADIDRPE